MGPLGKIALSCMLSFTLMSSAFGLVRVPESAEEQTLRGVVATWVYLEHPNDSPGIETTAEVTLAGKVIVREEKVKSIQIAWGSPHTPPYSLLLLSIYPPDSRLCEAYFRLVDLTKTEPPFVTRRFGNCHSEPFVNGHNGKVIIYFPLFGGKPEEAYAYTPQDGLKKIPVTASIRAGASK